MNHAGFVMKFGEKNDRTGQSKETGHYDIDQTKCINLKEEVDGTDVGDEFTTTISAVLGKTKQANRKVAFSPNNLTATFECKGTTLDYHCNLLVR